MKAALTQLRVVRYFVLLYLMQISCAMALANSEGKITCYALKAEHQEHARQMLRDYVSQSLAKANNIMAEAYYEQESPNVLWLIERWVNGPNKSVAISEEVLLTPAKVYIVNDLEPLSKEQWRRSANRTDSSFTVMLFVDSKTGTEDSFKSIYHNAMPKFRSEAGVVTYQLSQFSADITQFVTYEKFRNEAAFQYHLTFPPIKPVISYLETNIKNPPFQNGLHKLIEFAPLKRE